jgi:hypothetical protein
MTTSSSSATAIKKRRCVRMIVPMPKQHLLLLGTPQLHPPLPPTTMMHLMRCKVIVLAVIHPIGCKMVVMMVETRLVCLKATTPKGVSAGA